MRTKMTAIHPGEFLAEILDELGVSQAAFARAAGVSPMRDGGASDQYFDHTGSLLAGLPSAVKS